MFVNFYAINVAFIAIKGLEPCKLRRHFRYLILSSLRLNPSRATLQSKVMMSIDYLIDSKILGWSGYFVVINQFVQLFDGLSAFFDVFNLKTLQKCIA